MKTLLVAISLSFVAMNAGADVVMKSTSVKYDAGVISNQGERTEKAIEAKNQALQIATQELENSCNSTDQVDFVNVTETRAGRSRTGVNMKLTVSAICRSTAQ